MKKRDHNEEEDYDMKKSNTILSRVFAYIQ